ncbi:MAG: DUF2062 domain-containing protein [Myxococcota bacterium]
MIRKLYERLKDVVVRRILGVDDTPHRIATGVLLGFIVAMTPTLGFQIAIYVAIASLIRTNKVSGVPILFISNPFTAAPLYYFCWWLGSLLLHGGAAEDGAAIVEERLEGAENQDSNFWTDMWTTEFWTDLGETLWNMGAELWVGSLVLGVATGVPFYFITRWAVTQYRRLRADKPGSPG